MSSSTTTVWRSIPHLYPLVFHHTTDTHTEDIAHFWLDESGQHPRQDSNFTYQLKYWWNTYNFEFLNHTLNNHTRKHLIYFHHTDTHIWVFYLGLDLSFNNKYREGHQCLVGQERSRTLVSNCWFVNSFLGQKNWWFQTVVSSQKGMRTSQIEPIVNESIYDTVTGTWGNNDVLVQSVERV